MHSLRLVGTAGRFAVNNANKLVLVLIAGLLALSLASSFIEPVVADFFRFPIECVMCWYLWKGANWARWLTGILAALACILLTVPVLQASLHIEAAALLVVLALFHGFAAYVLLTRKWVAAHFTSRSVNGPVQQIACEHAQDAQVDKSA